MLIKIIIIFLIIGNILSIGYNIYLKNEMSKMIYYSTANKVFQSRFSGILWSFEKKTVPNISLENIIQNVEEISRFNQLGGFTTYHYAELNEPMNLFVILRNYDSVLRKVQSKLIKNQKITKLDKEKYSIIYRNLHRLAIDLMNENAKKHEVDIESIYTSITPKFKYFSE